MAYAWSERWTGDREVADSTLTHCAVEYGPGQATHAHLPLSLSSMIWYKWKGGDALKLGSE